MSEERLTECGRVAFETWRDGEPDGWGAGIEWHELHPRTQEPWVELANAVIRKWETGS